jgi:hypothetical protein
MANDNLTTQSATPATLPAGAKIATRSVTYSGDTESHLAPVALVTLTGADDAKTAADIDETNGLPIAGREFTESYPNPNQIAGGKASARVDSFGNLQVRGPVTTDEQGWRDCFSGSSVGLALTGTPTFANGSASVTGVGTAFTTEIESGEYIKRDSDGNTAWARVEEVISDTELTLSAVYSGASGGSASSVATVASFTGTGGSISVASSALTIASGTTTTAETGVRRLVDYAPIVFEAADVSLSQRIANQTAILGLQQRGQTAAARYYARFEFDGTVNTQVKCAAAWTKSGSLTANDIQTTTVTLPPGLTTATAARYRIELAVFYTRFYVNDILLAEHRTHLPNPYDYVDVVAYWVNGGSAPATSSNLVINSMAIRNINKLDVEITSNVDSVSINNAPGPLFTGSAAANNNDLLFIDCAQFRAIAVQVTSIGGGATISFQGSNDSAFGGTPVALQAIPAAGGAAVTTTNAVGHWVIPVMTRYMRIRTTAYTSGTQTATAFAMQQVPQILSQITASITGTPTVTANLGTGGTGATALGKAEDAAAANGDTGVAVFAVRRSAPSTDTSAAGDYGTLQINDTGSLWVNPTSNLADNAGFTDGTTPVTAVGFIVDETAGTALTENDIGAARMDSKRSIVNVLEDATTRGQRAGVNTSGALQVTQVPHTAGGLTTYTLISAATNNAQSVKATAGQLYAYQLFNNGASPVYVKFFNKNSAPAVGTDTPVKTVMVPAGGGANMEWTNGVAFAAGIAICCVTGIAPLNNTVVAADQVAINIDYK